MEGCVIYDEQLEYSYWRYGEIFDGGEVAGEWIERLDVMMEGASWVRLESN